MYDIVLYNHGKRVKKIRSYNLYSNAIKKHAKLLEANKVYFPKETLWNGMSTDYELAITAPLENKPQLFTKDKFGKNIKIVTNGKFVIKKIEKYQIEDVFTERITGKRLDFKMLVKHLMKTQNTYVITLISNKMVIERFQNEDVDLYILKDRSAAHLLFETLREFNNANKLTNYIYFLEPTVETKRRIYNTLLSEYGITKDYMYKTSTS